MTTEKVQSKIKSSTIAITVLSILLALAVASTIVLAAFSQSKEVTTTLTFGGNLTLEIGGTSNKDFTYAADTANKSITITPIGDGFTKTAEMPAINGKTNISAYSGYKIAVTAKNRNSQPVTMTAGDSNTFTASDDSGLEVVVTPATNFTQNTTNKDCWINATAPLNATGTTDMITKISIGGDNIDSLMGYEVTITITFYAEDSQTATQETILAGLNP